MSSPWDAVKKLSDEMAEDGGLWFMAQTCAEAYQQQELRKLCAAIDKAAEGHASVPATEGSHPQ